MLQNPLSLLTPIDVEDVCLGADVNLPTSNSFVISLTYGDSGDEEPTVSLRSAQRPCESVSLTPNSPTYASIPNGLCAALMTIAFVVSVVMMTERVFFVVDVSVLETVSGTMWQVTRTNIKDAGNATTLSLLDGLFSDCLGQDSLVVTVVTMMRVGAAVMTIASFAAAALLAVDGVWRALPRAIVVTPTVIFCVAVVMRWVSENALFTTRFCDATLPLQSQGYIDISSLTSKIAVVLLGTLSGVVYYVLYPIHHLLLVTGVQIAEGDTSLRNPLLVGVGLGAVLAVV